jgi:hypothetical protein
MYHLQVSALSTVALLVNDFFDDVRIRRVKCDETKPECERCTSTGRKCDGYLTHAPKKTDPGPKPDLDELVVCQSINWEQGDFAERRAIDFFRCRTAPSVSSYFDADFVSPYFTTGSKNKS